MDFPEELKYTKSHEWVRVLDGGVLEIGLTDYAQDVLGDVIFANLPEAGDTLRAGEVFADAESAKTVSDIFSPVDGSVEAVNDGVLSDPAKINKAPYDTWLVRVKRTGEVTEVLNAAQYRALIDR